MFSSDEEVICSFCELTALECGGVVGAKGGHAICEKCASIAYTIFSRRTVIMTQAKKEASEYRAKGMDADENGECLCVRCITTRLIYKDEVIMKVVATSGAEQNAPTTSTKQ
jgi:hypothetical protein